jgi:hypothetical protein
MRRVFKNYSTLLTILAAALLTTACNQEVDKIVQTNTGIGNGGGTTTPVTSNGGVECGPDNYCINVIPPQNTTMVLHQDGDYSQPCIVLPGTDTACILEAQELDLYGQGMELSYNVPAGMCPYFSYQPYFYYQYQPGKGPTAVTIYDNEDLGTITASPSPIGIPDADSANTQQVIVSQPYSTTPVCSTDYTAVGGPNCCYGQYLLTVTTTVNGDTTSSITSQEWGGNPNNCLTGPAIDTQILTQGTGYLTTGYPLASIYALDGNSISGTYTVKPPIKRLDHSNAYIANYWQSATIGSYPQSGAPNAMQVPQITNGRVYFNNPNPWYEFDCLDPAQDVIARIRVMVRSWSSNAQFAQMVATQNGTPTNGTYNLYGSEPTPFGDQPILDRETWVDPANSSGTYATFSSGVSGAGTAIEPCFTTSCGFGSMYPGLGN